MDRYDLLDPMLGDTAFKAAMARPLTEAEKLDGNEVLSELRRQRDQASLDVESLASQLERSGVDAVTAFRMRAYFAAQNLTDSSVALHARARVCAWDRADSTPMAATAG